MKFNTSIYILLLLLIISSTTIANGQYFRSGYFVEGATYGHLMNPSFIPEKSYCSLLTGKINAELQCNVGLSNFIFPYNDPDGKCNTVTFLNKTVSANEFLDGLNHKNLFEFNISPTLFSAGFFVFDGFSSLSISLHSNTSFNIPFEFFKFLKKGMDDIDGTSYSITNMKLKSLNYGQIAFGHSHKINDKLKIGVKLKLLLGLGYINVGVNKIDLYMSNQQWQITTDASIKTALTGVSLETESNENGNIVSGVNIDELINSVNELDYKSLLFKNPGIAIDLGGNYEIIDGLLLSASILDLGAIFWENPLEAGTTGESYTYDGYENINPLGGDNLFESINEQSEYIVNTVTGLFKLYDKSTDCKKQIMIPTTINFGTDYTMPFSKNITVGVLSSTKINKGCSWTEGRLAATASPSKWFDLSISYGISNFGSSMGWLMNIQPGAFNIFIGSDNIFLPKLSPQLIPINKTKTSIYFGINITGKKHE